ncbi:winged helix-turn-helix domain-containing protein [Adlercreutzia murintestinalis]|jgi:N-terminal domain of molybdenum-binding protein|uniref:winged helix-turn-helix domain-containing protein n=1 Tax=Adlercreutzia murintestinalis TaxID=2941325 RepID=UPI00203AD0F0|nr:LysR family transcriptional regulator [Adlercreutzia murintestinalis]
MTTKLSKLVPNTRLSISNPKSNSNSVFGKGIADLCLGVRQHGSLNAAAKNMGMAYSKAWRIIKDTEDALDIQLLIRDGAHGSELTPEGNRLLELYTRINQEISQKAVELYQEISQ